MRTLSFISLIVLGTWATSSLAGAPLKGIDVKLGKNPGGFAAARLSSTGSFSFGVLPAGEYTFELVLNDRATGGPLYGQLAISDGRHTVREPISLRRTDRKSGSVIFQNVVRSDGKDPIEGTLVAT
jgi:hypothetical protein